jgi:hypothetical protein
MFDNLPLPDQRQITTLVKGSLRNSPDEGIAYLQP